MTLTELRYIVAVAKTKHFGKAADHCFVSQSTLSVAIRKLEDELGVTIFERGRAEVRITAIGQSLLQEAERVLEQTRTLKRIAAAGRDQFKDPVRLGALNTIGRYLFPHLILQLHVHDQAQSLAPLTPLTPLTPLAPLTLLLKEDLPKNLLEDLLQGHIDAALWSGPVDQYDVISNDLRIEQLYTEPLIALLPARHVLAKRVGVCVADLSEYCILLPPTGCGLRENILQEIPVLASSLEQHPMPLMVQEERLSMEMLQHAVAMGFGLAILPQMVLNVPYLAPSLVVTRPFVPPMPVRTIALVSHKGFPRPKALDALRQALRALCVPGLSVVLPVESPVV
jgi:LysR family hydrogen peroxide-inducible transcriptional activator